MRVRLVGVCSLDQEELHQREEIGAGRSRKEQGAPGVPGERRSAGPPPALSAGAASVGWPGLGERRETQLKIETLVTLHYTTLH